MNHLLSYIISFPIIIAAIFLMLLDLALSPFVFLARQLLNKKIIVFSKAIVEMKDEMQKIITSDEIDYKKIRIKKNYKNNGSNAHKKPVLVTPLEESKYSLEFGRKLRFPAKRVID